GRRAVRVGAPADEDAFLGVRARRAVSVLGSLLLMRQAIRRNIDSVKISLDHCGNRRYVIFTM
ncbi:hypothetical protein, partial [Bradyrhizobium sp. PRIMUS42]|uniref:hypothetical protein n=1 Tax=Bradyrhizobium sp. PRIMUS42 TaxID=2908926 RepID=UPI001FF49C86